MPELAGFAAYRRRVDLRAGSPGRPTPAAVATRGGGRGGRLLRRAGTRAGRDRHDRRSVVGRRGGVRGVHSGVGRATTLGAAGAPYRPGLLALRPGHVLADVVRALPATPDVLLVDATGDDRPRGVGARHPPGRRAARPPHRGHAPPAARRGDWPPDQRGARGPLLGASPVMPEPTSCADRPVRPGVFGSNSGTRVSRRRLAGPPRAETEWRPQPARGGPGAWGVGSSCETGASTSATLREDRARRRRSSLSSNPNSNWSTAGASPSRSTIRAPARRASSDSMWRGFLAPEPANHEDIR